MKAVSLLALPFLLLSNTVFSQAPPEIPPTGGGGYEPEPGVCLSEERRAEIISILQENSRQLREQGLLPEGGPRVTAFAWPFANASGLSWNAAYGISNYIDEDAGGGILDYNCGSRTYDTHRGTDIFSWPFPGYLQDNDLVEVHAGAPGTIIAKIDGYADDHCSCVNYDWNAVYVQHADGSVAWYGHMKNGSLTSKTVGQTVVTGEYLGVVGSSGCSTGPHLHFEVWTSSAYTQLVDPWWVSGGCNTFNSQTWWASQQPYREKTLNCNLTHDAPPVHGCPIANENPHFKDAFSNGQLAYFAAYYHDQSSGDVSTMSLIKPDGTVWTSPGPGTWTLTSPSTYNASWWYWSYYLPSGGPYGTWKWRVTYQGVTTDHAFTYAAALPAELLDFRADLQPDRSARLDWRTTNEQNLSHFSVERSPDGEDWQPLGQIPAIGRQGKETPYLFTDPKPLAGRNHYRLRLADFDGAEVFSNIASVIRPVVQPMRLFPNPAEAGRTTLVFDRETSGETVAIRLFGPTGQLVRQTQLADSPSCELDLKGLPPGIYSIVATGEWGISVEKLVVK